MRLNRAPILLILMLALIALVAVVLVPEMRPLTWIVWIDEKLPAWRDWLVTTAILSLVALGIYAAGHSRYYESAKTPAYQSKLLVDRPIRDAAADEFGWGRVSGVIAELLRLPPAAPSLVVAVEAAWGSGKTSLLKLVEISLRELQPAPIIVRFNPWSSGNVSNLSNALLEAIVQGVVAQGRAPVLVSALDSFRRDFDEVRLTGLTWIGLQFARGIGRIFRDPTDQKSVLSRKTAISEALNRLDRSVVVFVDDADRLQPDQIKEVFGLIGSVTDFDRVAYLLAYDPRPIFAALEFEGQEGFGKEYKDKIVQVTIPFPKIPYTDRKRYLHSAFLTAAENWGIELSVEDKEELEQAIPRVLRAIRTPRHAKLAINGTFIATTIQNAEVSVSDLLAFETLAVAT